MATRRTAHQQFLLKPDPQLNNDVIYCIGVAAERHEVQVMDFNALSDHLHQQFYDRHGNAPAYLRDVHGFLAKVCNARFGRSENLWSSSKPSLVRLEDQGAIVDRLVYIATNAVKHNLVESWQDWPGARGFAALISGKPLTATKPKFFSRKSKKMPDKVTLYLRIPPEVGDHDTIIAMVLVRVAATERFFAHERALTGQPVLGRTKILRESRDAHARTRSSCRTLNPTLAAKLLENRLVAIQRKRDFERDYRKALLAYRAGAPIPFPVGTYWLVRHLGVPVELSEKLS